MLIPMKNLTKLVMLGLLLVPFAAVINLGNAFAETVDVIIPPGTATPGCEVENMCWNPSTLEVAVGTTVAWTNKDAAGHTVTSGNPGDADSGALFDSTKDPAGFLIKPETTWQYTFDTAGEFPYFCQVHPWMVGKVIVTEGAMPEPEPMPEEPEEPEEMPANALALTTDNGSVEVQVTIDKGMVHGSEVMIDPPQEVKFFINFMDPTTKQPISHVNYQFHVADASGAMVAHEMSRHTHEGADTKSVAFSDTGSFTLMVVVEGTGINPPFDTAYSGTASSMVTVTPEFPLSVMAIMAAVVGIGVAATRFKNPLKL
jgi:plastocyanin